jgi:hypothetical protein
MSDEDYDLWKFRIMELHNLQLSTNIVKLIKSRILRWADHVVRMEECSSLRTIPR